jgi:vitamin B12 transporter
VLKAATTLDASAAWPLSRRVQVTARVENLTDALVMAAYNGDGSIERATPRTLWIGLRLR